MPSQAIIFALFSHTIQLRDENMVLLILLHHSFVLEAIELPPLHCHSTILKHLNTPDYSSLFKILFSLVFFFFLL